MGPLGRKAQGFFSAVEKPQLIFFEEQSIPTLVRLTWPIGDRLCVFIVCVYALNVASYSIRFSIVFSLRINDVSPIPPGIES